MCLALNAKLKLVTQAAQIRFVKMPKGFALLE